MTNTVIERSLFNTLYTDVDRFETPDFRDNRSTIAILTSTF